MGTAIGTMLKVHRVVAVKVRPARNSIRVTGPERARRIRRVQPERLRMLAKAVDVRHGWKRSLEAQVLRLKDERVIGDRKQYLARAGARDVERERRQGVRKFDLRCIWVHARVGRGPREDRLRDFVAFAGCVGDLEVNSRLCAVGRGKATIRSCIFILCRAVDIPVSYTTTRSRTLMSLPYTLQGLPARTRLADSLGPSTLTLVAS